MKNWLIVGRRASCVLTSILLASCSTEEERVAFRLAPEGFRLMVPESANADDFVPFSGRYPGSAVAFSGGEVTFTGPEDEFRFLTGSTPLDAYEFSLPPGEYRLETDIPPASIYGQATASYTAEPRTVVIGDTTTRVRLNVEASCALCLVRDSTDQLEGKAYILEKHAVSGFSRLHPMTRDSATGFFYAYLTPVTDPADPGAYLWFEDRAPGPGETGMSTSEFRTGYQYLVEILE